jgi:hypothetical protein
MQNLGFLGCPRSRVGPADISCVCVCACECARKYVFVCVLHALLVTVLYVSDFPSLERHVRAVCVILGVFMCMFAKY